MNMSVDTLLNDLVEIKKTGISSVELQESAMIAQSAHDTLELAELALSHDFSHYAGSSARDTPNDTVARFNSVAPSVEESIKIAFIGGLRPQSRNMVVRYLGQESIALMLQGQDAERILRKSLKRMEIVDGIYNCNGCGRI